MNEWLDQHEQLTTVKIESENIKLGQTVLEYNTMVQLNKEVLSHIRSFVKPLVKSIVNEVNYGYNRLKSSANTIKNAAVATALIASASH